MIHLDTNVVLWVHQNNTAHFPPKVRKWLRGARPMISPMVRVELAFLHERGRLNFTAAEILEDLRLQIDLGIAESRLEQVAAIASTLKWTRDPFDRMITAHALADDLPLLTKDATILTNCPLACWE